MDRKCLLGWLVVFVAWMAGSFVVHGALLGADYTALQGKLFRTPEDSHQYIPLMLLAHVLLADFERGQEIAEPAQIAHRVVGDAPQHVERVVTLGDW